MRKELTLKNRFWCLDKGVHLNPALERITVKGINEELFREKQFRRIAHKFRIRGKVPTNEINAVATIEASLRKGGLFTPVCELRQVLPEYLALIDRAGFRDHQAQYVDAILNLMSKEGVFIERFYFDGDPRACRKKDPGSPQVALQDLAAKYPEHRLVIFSNGAGLMDPFTGYSQSFIDVFQQWRDRALFTPESPAYWGYREWALNADFAVLPLSDFGFSAFVETIHTGIANQREFDGAGPRFPALLRERPEQWLQQHAPDKKIVDRLCMQVRRFLGNAGYCWLGACAVYPMLQWDITLYLGATLTDNDGRRLLNDEKLSALVQLPWFRRGDMPDWLRLRLIEDLGEQEKQVRESLVMLLESAKDHPDGFALEIAKDKEDKGLSERREWKTVLRDLFKKRPKDGLLQDHVFLKFMSGRKPPPDWLRLRLIEDLGEQEKQVRESLVMLLESAKDHPDGFALEIAKDKEDKGLSERREWKTVLRDLFKKRPKDGLLQDHVFLKFMSGRKPPKIALRLPDALRKIFFKEETGVLDKEDLSEFFFNTVRVNASGRIIKKESKKAKYFREDLGNGVTMDMVKIPGGTFTMGSPSNEANRFDDEGPQHQVTVSPFYMGKFEVTQAQWRAVMGTDPSRFKGGDLPVENVSWNDAVEFCERLSQKTDKQYRLPSEAEWEYACRAGTTTPFAFGETITPEIVNYDGNYPYGSAPKGEYRGKTVPVGSLGAANAFGLYDMHGNVWEWCADVWHENYNGAPSNGSVWEVGADNTYRVLRGGSWYLGGNCRSALRGRDGPGDRNNNLGFRVVIFGARTL